MEHRFRARESAIVLEALLVEDDDLDARVLTAFADMNAHCEIHFTRARTVAEALRLTGARRFDIYFVDLNVGERSSLRLLATLEKAGVRPVVISSVSPQEVERYRLNSGALRFLSKGDVSAERIDDLVTEALQTRALDTAA